MREEPIAVTGIGVLLPGARDVATFWDHLRSGRSQLTALDRFDPAEQDMDVFVGGTIGECEYDRLLPDLPERYARKYGPEILAAIYSAASARDDAGLRMADINPRRVSVIESSSRAGLNWWLRPETDPSDVTDKGAYLRGLSASAASLAAIHLGARGLVTTVSSACVGGHHAIGLALRELRAGASDVVFVGGHEFPLNPTLMRAMAGLGKGVLSTERDDPANAIRPYSANRIGMALGEGAVTLVLERASDAAARGADVYAHIHRVESMNEAGSAMSMDLTGKLTADLIREVVEGAGHRIDEVDYFCGHGTATRNNDLAESRSLRTIYPDRSSEALPPIGSNKPIFGHTLGIAGIVNVAATALMLKNQELAPTINVGEVDPECDHDHVVEGARPADLELAVSMTFAIGSQTSVALMGKDQTGSGSRPRGAGR